MIVPPKEGISLAAAVFEDAPGEDLSEVDLPHTVFSEEFEECDRSSTSSVSAIDWAHLHQLSDGNRQFELELLRLFVEDSWQHLDILKQAVTALLNPRGQNQTNFWQAERVAHYLMGASANVGAWKVQQAADLLEQQFRSHSIEGVSPLLVELEAALTHVAKLV